MMLRAILAAALLAGSAAQAQDGADADRPGDLRETGFVERNATFAVKCNTADIACVSPELGGFDHRAMRAYAIVMADAAAAADAWLTELGFSDSDLETLEGRQLILLDGAAQPRAAGFVTYAIDGTARLELPTRSTTRVFMKGRGSMANIPATMNPATLERIGDIALTIDERAFNSQFGQLIAHELFHARVDGEDEVLWLEEAMATSVGDAWGIRAGYGPDPGRKRAMRLDAPFDDNSEDARGISYGYGKAPFLLYVGEEAGSQDRVEYLARLRVPTDSRNGKLRDRDGGMGYLYDRSIMPEGLTFPEAFPRFVASRNQIVPRQTGGRSVLWDPFETEEDYYFTRLYRPLIDQAQRVSKEHAFDRSVADLAADPIHLEDTTLRFDPTAEEHERLMLARVSIEPKEPGAGLRLVFEHRLIEGNAHAYLTVAEGRYDAGYVRVVNAPERLEDAVPRDYTFKMHFAPVEITVPGCVEVGETVEIGFDGFAPDDVDNLRFEVSGNATLDGTAITATAPGPLRVTALVEPHRTRAPIATASTAPYDWPDRRVPLAPSRIVPEGGCRCTGDSLMALSNPQMWKMNDAFSTAIGAGPISGPLKEMLMGSVGLGGSLPAGHSTGHLGLQTGAHGAQGSVCVDPLLTTQGGDTVVSLYTPSVPTLLGSYDPFAVAHSGWGGWPANATASAAIVIRATPDALEAGRSYQAEMAGLQSTGFFPLYSEYEGDFHDYIPWQEAFTGHSLSIRPQRVAGIVRIDSVERGVVEGTLRLAGTGTEIAAEHWLREGTRDTFEHEGTETPTRISVTGRFSAVIPERAETVLRAGGVFETAPRPR